MGTVAVGEFGKGRATRHRFRSRRCRPPQHNRQTEVLVRELTLAIPDDWRSVELAPEAPRADFVATGPAGYNDYIPSVVVTHSPDVADTLEHWVSQMLDTSKQQVFTTLRIIDSANTTIAEHPAIVNVITFTIESLSVTQEQFAFFDASSTFDSTTGYVLTFSCASADYPKYIETFAAMAQSFELPGGTS